MVKLRTSSDQIPVFKPDPSNTENILVLYLKWLMSVNKYINHDVPILQARVYKLRIEDDHYKN